jgi:hypothetical protein
MAATVAEVQPTVQSVLRGPPASPPPDREQWHAVNRRPERSGIVDSAGDSATRCLARLSADPTCVPHGKAPRPRAVTQRRHGIT